MIDQTISQYKILEKLGEGGMGVVYKAQDTKLDRFVALKFLPPHLARLNDAVGQAASEQDKARFIQEAKAASALNHPNVCTIHDIQDYESPDGSKQMFIVMEYVDGQTLRDKKDVVSIKQALDIGIQIADGLSAAHEKGIVHRDIKPDNIMVRKDGIVQIMDFGLAKLRSSESKIVRLTKMGSTVGTAGYMSPEQVQGQEADHRSDIFSLGVLLYELIAGQLPFKGMHETALAYEIVNVDPAPMNSVKPEIEPSLDAIVLECLAKEPDERTQSAKQVSVDLKRYRRESSRSRASRITAARPFYQPSGYDTLSAAPTGQRENKVDRLPWMIAAVFLILSIVTVAYHFISISGSEMLPVRFTVAPAAKGTLESYSPIISPNGTMLAYVSRDSAGISLLWVRRLAYLNAEALPGTENASYPFWSPDNKFLGFFQNGKLKKISVNGGPTQSIADASDGRGGSWSTLGEIVFSPSYGSAVFKVSEAGGTVVQVSTLDTSRKEDTHRFPCFLPGGKHFLYFSRSSSTELTGVYFTSIDGKENKLLLVSKSSVAYAAPGYLLFLRDKALMAQPFDASNGEFKGDAFPIAQDIASNTRSNSYFSVSENGVLCYVTGGFSGERQLIWFNRDGKSPVKIGTAGTIGDFALSPDEKRVVFRRIDNQTGNNDLWILDIIRKTESRFTFKPALDDDPVWSPDGNSIIFDSNPEGVPNPFQKVASGAGAEQRLLKSNVSTVPYDWTSDGKYILLRQENVATKVDLIALPMFGDKKPFPVVQTEAQEDLGRFSPDGRWVAYMSDESGKNEVYIQAFPVSEGKWQVSVNGGGSPVWAKSGKEIFYLAPDKKLMAVDITLKQNSVEQGIPKPLFDTFVDSYDAPNRYAVSRDGKRFLVNSSADSDSTKPITVVLNWTVEFKKK